VLIYEYVSMWLYVCMYVHFSSFLGFCYRFCVGFWLWDERSKAVGTPGQDYYELLGRLGRIGMKMEKGRLWIQ